MDMSMRLSKRIAALESRQVSGSVPEWVLQNCDWRRKLAQYKAILAGCQTRTLKPGLQSERLA